MQIKCFLMLGALLPFALPAVEIEAESGILTAADAVVVQSAQASGGKAVRFKGSAARKQAVKAPAKDEAPSLTLKAVFSHDGKYTVTALIYAATTNSDSVFWALDDGKPKDVHTGFPKAGFPVKLYSGRVAAGEHQIKFWTREPGFEIDKIIIEEAK